MSPFFVPFKYRFNAVLRHCLHITLERSKSTAHKNGDVDVTRKQAIIPATSCLPEAVRIKSTHRYMEDLYRVVQHVDLCRHILPLPGRHLGTSGVTHRVGSQSQLSLQKQPQ